MSLDAPEPHLIDGSSFRIGLVTTAYNQALVDALRESCIAVLADSGAPVPEVETVPGAAELPYAAACLAKARPFDAVIVLGVVIAGETNHHRIIGESTATTLQRLSIDAGMPVINGILVVETREQAEARACGPINRGREFALAALQMARFKQKWTNKNPK